MSEYQYYEFQTVDRPLDERAMTALRAITSRHPHAKAPRLSNYLMRNP